VAGTAVVVGNPVHDGLHTLPGASKAAQSLARGVRLRGLVSVPNSGALLSEHATREAVLAALDSGGPALWAQMGHGGRPSEHGAAEYSAMAGSDKLRPMDVARLRWTNHPVVHHDCCVAGTSRGRGGRRFDGHPGAALLAGASCVLSSVHPLWDDSAAEFSELLYHHALLKDQPLSLGAALVETRREMARRHRENPVDLGDHRAVAQSVGAAAGRWRFLTVSTVGPREPAGRVAR
jgi:hypothetical protein